MLRAEELLFKRRAGHYGGQKLVVKPTSYAHLKCLVKRKSLKTAEGRKIDVYELKLDLLDDPTIKNWAKHFREHYCLDSQIEALKEGTPYQSSRSAYLEHMRFPSGKGFGPATRSGDFTEILVADFAESVLGFWVPRERYATKQIRDESPKGADIVGMKFDTAPTVESPKDTLATFEVKGQMGKESESRLQAAVDDAAKDDVLGEFRVSQTLNALKQRFLERADSTSMSAVQRFQDPIARPYVHRMGATVVLCSSAFNAAHIQAVETSKHRPDASLMLLAVHGDEMMKLIHTMYKRAADEA